MKKKIRMTKLREMKLSNKIIEKVIILSQRLTKTMNLRIKSLNYITITMISIILGVSSMKIDLI